MKKSLAGLSKCVLKAKSQLPHQTKAKRLANVAAKEKVFSDASALYGRAVRSESSVYVRAAAERNREISQTSTSDFAAPAVEIAKLEMLWRHQSREQLLVARPCKEQQRSTYVSGSLRTTS